MTEYEEMTAKAVMKKYPFLAGLIKESGIGLMKRVKIRFLINEPLDISAPFHDGCCRYTSRGTISEEGKITSKSHYAGCYDTCLNNPTEVLGVGTEGKVVKEKAFYAIFDWFEHWRSRHITVYLRTEEVKEIEVRT